MLELIKKKEITMEGLTALICDSCGGHIDRETLKCSHCGTAYRVNSHGTLEMITSEKRIIYLYESVIIPAEYVQMDAEKAMEYGLRELAEALAKRMLPLCKWVQEYTPKDMCYRLNMRIGVADPETTNTRHLIWKDY